MTLSRLQTCALGAVLLLMPFASGCVSSTAPTQTPPFTQTDLRLGTGEVAATGNSLSVNYTGWLYNDAAPDGKGVQFDSNASSGTPFTFTLGSGQVIQGWDQGIVGQRVGGIRRLIIPPSLAYDGSRRGLIPPHATLIFELELLTVQ